MTNDAEARVLRVRARALALPPEQAAPSTALEVLEFRLAQERYAIETRHVREVHPLRDLTPLPNTPSFVRGIVNVRGRIIAVLDLKKFFDLPEQGLTDLHRIILIEAPDMELGLVADATVGVRLLAVEMLQPPLPTLTGIRSEYLTGVTADRLVVLDVRRLVADSGIIVHEEVENS